MVSACLGKPLATILGHLKAVFPPAAACLAAQGGAASSSPPAQGIPTSAADLMLDEDEDEEGASAHVRYACQISLP